MGLIVELKDYSFEVPVYGATRSLKSQVFRSGGRISKLNQQNFVKVLDNINFSLAAGDRVGVYGPNGSGKTSFLRALVGAYPPTTGEYKCFGTITSMIDVMVGMDFEFSGRENIRLRGLLMGQSEDVINDIINQVELNSGLDQFLDAPVRIYSSGMQMRLAFCVAVSIPASVLIMDEWLSVGDEEFANTSTRMMKTFVDKCDAMVLASHNMDLIKRVCNKVIIMKNGGISRAYQI